MAASRQSLSPTANLLRNSRLFSLPNPLPRPLVGDNLGSGVTKASDTATLPYPTHQAIATTKSSLARGDWGLKRALPSRSRLVQVSDPVLRVTQLDTIEHVTDFDSAADHVRTREKWQEMGVPMMQGLSNLRDFGTAAVQPRGAFEKRDDTTSYDTDLGLDEAGLYLQALKTTLSGKGKNTKSLPEFVPFALPAMDPEVHNTKRWKHDGPWIPGMGAADFITYLSKEISKRREEFNAHLISHVKNVIYTSRKYDASKSSDKPPIDIEEAEKWQAEREKEWRAISQQDIDASIKNLRREVALDPLNSRLFQSLIVPFLRLPTIKLKNRTFDRDGKSRDSDVFVFDQDTTPLSTHPSAGLGYLKTKSYLTNHPILGPQAKPTPIPARVVQPRNMPTRSEVYARLGVAGFIANDQYRSTDSISSLRQQGVKDVGSIDIDTPGGRKIMVNPSFGSITPTGRVLIKLQRAVGAEVAVARGELDDKPPHRPNEKVPFDVLSGNMSSDMRQSDDAKRFAELIKTVESEGKAKPGPGFPGVKDALRSE